jgi:cell shape-determining protein MreC
MVYIQRTSEKRKSKKHRAVIYLIIASIALLGFFFRDFSAQLVHNIVYPINKGFDFVVSPITGAGDYFSSKKTLLEQNERLINENKILNIEKRTTEAIQKQNQELKSILSVRDGLSTQRMTAEVILTPPFSPFDTFVLRITNNFEQDGSEVNQKISVGDAVFIKNILVGEITEVYDRTAIATLYSTYNKSLPVRVNDEFIAEAFGFGGLSFEIELPKDLEIEEGAPIFKRSTSNIHSASMTLDLWRLSTNLC